MGPDLQDEVPQFVRRRSDVILGDHCRYDRGGIRTGTDVVEFLAAGAAAVGVGTAALADPAAMVRIKSELIDYMHENDFASISELKHAFTI